MHSKGKGVTAMIEAICFEDGKFWVIDIPALKGITQALGRDEIEAVVFDFFECQTEQTANPADFKFTILEGEAAVEHVQVIEKRFADLDAKIAAHDAAQEEKAS